MSFLSELKRRNVVRMGVLYVVASWVALQIADVIFEPLGVPGWVFRLMLSLLALGFPFALVFAWIYELTPEGLKRERDIDADKSIVRHTGNRMNTVIVILLVVAIGGLILNRVVPHTTVESSASTDIVESPAPSTGEAGPGPASGEENSIAVLPFVNMSGDPDNEYFSDGLTEELLNSLVQLGGLQVTGRTSSFAFKGQNQDLREIGQLLNVANVLEGSVRKAGNRVRITVQLIKTSDGYHLWSETFDRELDDIFAIQAEIASQVSNALHLTLLGDADSGQPETIPATDNAEAYEEYLRGMYVLQHDPDDRGALERARLHFDRALEIDPDYVDAHWGLFRVWDQYNRNGTIPFYESLALMQRTKDTINLLAPGSERALNSSGRAAAVIFNYQTALEYMQEAVRRYPGSAPAQTGYASMLNLVNPANRPGSSAQARALAREAIEVSIKLDPLSLAALQTKANWLLGEGECAELEETSRRALELEPDAGRFRAWLAACLYTEQGDLQKALTIVEQEPLGFARNTMKAILYHKLGQQDKAQRYLDQLYLDNGDAASYQYGQIHAQWGNTETALAWLNNALEIHDPGIILSGADRLLDPLRGDPKFQIVLESAGFR